MSSACASNLFSNPQCGQLTQTLYLSPVILSKRQALASDGITSTLKLPELNLDFGISKHTQSKLVLHLSQIWFPREYIGIFQPPKTIQTIHFCIDLHKPARVFRMYYIRYSSIRREVQTWTSVLAHRFFSSLLFFQTYWITHIRISAFCNYLTGQRNPQSQ